MGLHVYANRYMQPCAPLRFSLDWCWHALKVAAEANISLTIREQQSAYS